MSTLLLCWQVRRFLPLANRSRLAGVSAKVPGNSCVLLRLADESNAFDPIDLGDSGSQDRSFRGDLWLPG